MPSAVVYFDRTSLPIAGYGAERLGGGAARLLRGRLQQAGVDLRADQVRGERQLLRAGAAQLLGGRRDGALLVERRRHDRHGEARGQQHAGDPGGLHGLLAADRGEDDAVGGGRHREQPGAVGAGQARLGEPHVQRLGEQRVRAEDVGQLGGRTAVDHGLPDAAQ